MHWIGNRDEGYDPYDPVGHYGDYAARIEFEEQWEQEQSREAKKQRELENNILSQQKEIIKLKREIAERDKDNAIQDIKRYMGELAPNERFELETLLVRLNIIISESDSIDSVNTDNESASKSATVETTVVDESESAEQDLEKYLSKLTSEKREELEDILNRFREASTKLDELQKNIDSQKPKQKLLTTKQAIICWSIFFSVLILVGIITGFN